MKEEPSVLDYVKWIFSLNRNKQPLVIPAEQHDLLDWEGQVEESEPGMEGAQHTQYQPGILIRILKSFPLFPWRSFLALGLALLAQFGLEPPRQSENPSVLVPVLYFFSAVFAVWGILAREWDISEPEIAESEAPMDSRVRWISLLAGITVMPFALLAFQGNEFTDLNLFLWALCFLYIVLAFCQFSGKKLLPRLREGWAGLRERIQTPPVIQFKLTPFLILLVVALGMVLFFRFYRLSQVPAEMWSDHAEKLLDVNDLLKGQHKIFFERNTGREAFQFYLTALVVQVSGLGVGYLALKLGTVLAGLVALFYMYRLGKQVANPWVGLLALLLAGAAYWPNIVSRVALRYALYPLFTAPLLFYLIRGIRTSSRNDMIKAGIVLGLGLHGYSTYRIVPFLVVVAFILYILHGQSKAKRIQAMGGLVILALVSLVIFLPLLSFTLEKPDAFASRALSRLIPEGPTEKPLLQIFAENTWRASIMFFWDNGEIWVHSIPHRPAMDPVTAVMYFLGVVLLLVRYVRKHSWLDLFLLISIPILLLPSILSLTFPAENPSLNRTAGAYVPAFLIAAMGMEALGRAWFNRAKSLGWKVLAGAVMAGLIAMMAARNYTLVFQEYDLSFRRGAWNTSEMGTLIRDFSDSVGSPDTAYVVPYAYWVDTRLVGISAGYVEKDYALWPENFDITLSETRAKMFIIKAEDTASLDKLRQLYPGASYWLHQVPDLEGKDYFVFMVPAQPGETNSR